MNYEDHGVSWHCTAIHVILNAVNNLSVRWHW
jgi:hypothetical protein